MWTGDPDDGRRLLPALRGGTTPVAEQIQALTYLQLQSIDDIAQAPHKRRYWKGHYLRDFGDEAIVAFLSCGARDGDDEPDPALLASGDLQAYGGAIASVGPGETAFSHRDALIEFVARADWTDPAQMARLVAIKDHYDPDNIFHLNHNIPASQPTVSPGASAKQ